MSGIAGEAAERALFNGEIDGIVAAVHQNERPLSGLAGLLDWRFQGLLSLALKKGSIQGIPGECVYIPVSRHGKTFHLLLIGAGHSDTPGKRTPLPAASLRALAKNLKGLKLKSVGASLSDLGCAKEENLKRDLTGVPLWIAP